MHLDNKLLEEFGENNAAPERCPYRSPRLSSLGKLSAMTAAGTGSTQENGVALGQPGGPPYCNDGMGMTNRRPC